MKFAIVGSGFGLYGYLPALASLGHTIILPERYRERFAARSELAQFSSAVTWATDELSALAAADSAVIARRPEDQPQWIAQCAAAPNIARLILEKPLAPTPDESLQLHMMLDASGKTFRMGYTFCNLPWALRLAKVARAKPQGKASISWAFLAHHFQHDLANWKRFDASGGGAIRFYGIQLIAALAQAGYRDVADSRAMGASAGETTRWTAILRGAGLADCHVDLDCRSSTTHFNIASKNPDGSSAVIMQADDPFGKLKSSETDRRISALQDIAKSLTEQKTSALPWYSDALALWQTIEHQSKFSIC